MKKLFLLTALMGTVFTSCMNEEVQVPKYDTPISFEVANYVVQPRATGASPSVFSPDSVFGVNAWSHDAAAVSGNEVEMMKNVIVNYDEGNWTTETPYYWPINGTVDFIAYYPTRVKPTIVYKYDGSDTYSYTNYTVGNEDLMYADKAIRYSANATVSENKTNFGFGSYGFEGVPTLFHHALAKVNFKVKNAYPSETAEKANTTYEIVVEAITLKTYQKGSVTLTNSGAVTASRGAWSVANNVWTPTEGQELATLTWTDGENLITADEYSYASRTQYVLPQTLSDDVTVEVVYTVTQKQNGIPISVKQYASDAIKLNTMGLEKWEMNKNITYTISIKAESNQIFFAPAVEDWTASNPRTV